MAPKQQKKQKTQPPPGAGSWAKQSHVPPTRANLRKLPKTALVLIMLAWPWVMDIDAEVTATTGRDADAFELFGGHGAITRNIIDQDMVCTMMDKEANPNEDITTEQGFLLAVRLLMRVKCGGLTWAAPTCWSWIWLCRAISGRSKANPAGNEDTNPKIHYQNRIVIITSILLFIAWLRGTWYVIENPSSTLIPVSYTHLTLPTKRIV